MSRCPSSPSYHDSFSLSSPLSFIFRLSVTSYLLLPPIPFSFVLVTVSLLSTSPFCVLFVSLALEGSHAFKHAGVCRRILQEVQQEQRREQFRNPSLSRSVSTSILTHAHTPADAVSLSFLFQSQSKWSSHTFLFMLASVTALH